MIFFGHLGITTGAIKAYEKLFSKDKNPIDYRVVLVGSILPDLIDKPIGAFLFRSTFHNSRIFSHSLLFSAILISIGIYSLLSHGKNNILVLGISSFIHLILDSMWLYPSILFWPYFGFSFPVRPEGNWVQSDLIRLVSDPGYFLPEIIGFLIIAYFFISLIRNKGLKNFINFGRL